MDVKLKVLFGKNLGQELRIDGPRFFIGRSEDCQLRPKSDLVSRHHCAILVDSSGVAIRDFGSRNGTYVNEQRVVGERELAAGDRLRIGPMEFELVLTESKKRPKVASVKEAAVRTAKDAAKDSEGVDIEQWLADDEPTPTTAARETRAADTDTIDVAQTVVEAAKQGPPPDTGKPSAKPEPVTGDSGKAASDVLKKFFNRR